MMIDGTPDGRGNLKRTPRFPINGRELFHKLIDFRRPVQAFQSHDPEAEYKGQVLGIFRIRPVRIHHGPGFPIPKKGKVHDLNYFHKLAVIQEFLEFIRKFFTFRNSAKGSE